MNLKDRLKKVNKYQYEIAPFGKMLVPAKFFVSENLLKSVEESAIQQVINVAQLSGIVGESLAMPDVHSGYGFSIGGVAAFDLDKGIISPGGVGYDINCSVRLLKTNLTKKQFLEKQKQVTESLFRKIPSGVGRGSKFQITYKELDKLLENGAQYMVEKGYGIKEDYLNTEEQGCMKTANAKDVSEKAKKRGIGQIGTLGAGNHFLEVQAVEEIFDKKTAEVFGLEKDQILIMVHCGSRGLGHQVASDYIKEMEEKYSIKNLPDRELINAPIKSDLGKKYFSAMSCAANFAFANKQLITHWIREEMKYLFPEIKIDVVYDICHNIAKIEEHFVNGKKTKLCVHRKGATRAFGKGRKELPKKYQKTGQPILIPGTMGTSSYVLVGTEKAEQLTFASTAHGAGRSLSRIKAIKQFKGKSIKQELEKQGIQIKAGNEKSISEESPQAYKDIDEVVKTSHELGIGKLVAKLKPLSVIKG